MPLISYGIKTGSGTLALGTLPPGVFGYLTNDISSSPSFIGLVVTSVFQPRWEGLAGGSWDIQVTTNWIDLITGLPQYFYQGTKAIFDDEALGTTNVNLVTTVNPGGVLVTNALLNYTISGVGRITGGGGLTKLGTNLLTLNTTNNNYTGPTYIDEGGILTSTVTNNLGTNSALTIGTGTLSLGANSQKFSVVYMTNGTIAASGAILTAGSYNLDNGSVNALLAGGSLTTFGTNTDLVSVIGGNTYTDRTYLAGSTLAVNNLANGGSPSGIGTSSSGPTNLVFAGGGLSYSGPAVAIDRGYNVESGGRLTASGNITLGGPITATAGNFSKGGNGAVAYTALGTNVLSRGGGTAAYSVSAGTVVLSGGAITPTTNYLQTNIITGELWVGFDQTNAGTLIVTNTSLGISSWLAIDRGNGIVGSQSVASIYDSMVSVGNCSLGYDNGIIGNWERPVLNLYGRSKLNDAGALYVGESTGSTAQMNLSGTSVVTVAGSLLLARNTSTSTGAVQLASSALLLVNGSAGWLSVGSGGVGSFTMMNNSMMTNSRDENIADTTGSTGTLNIQDNATNLTANLYVGKSGTAVGVVNQSGGYLGRLNPAPLIAYADWRIGGNTVTDASAVGTYNLSGGLFEPFSNFQVGAYGTGFWNQSGGTANCASFPSMGRFPGSPSTLNISGGVFNQTGSGQLLIIGEQGTATLTITNTGLVNCVGGLSISHTATGIGVVNLDGGTLATRLVESPGAPLGGTGTLNLNGGLLQANASSAAFMTGLSAANVLAGGAIIDSSTNSITIAQPLLDGGTGGGLTKKGSGLLVLSGASTYTGATVVSNGTLELNGSIDSPSVDTKAGATLGGTGTIAGSATIETGGTLAPGASVGTLTIGGNLTIAGNLFIEVNKALSSSNDLTVVNGTLNNTGTGTVTVTNLNLAAPLVAGDSFKLFNQLLPNGGALTIVGSPGAGLGWTNHLALDGTIAVVQTVALNPTNLIYSLSGNSLTLSWPADHIDWTLQSQTNGLNAGLTATWHDVTGSSASNTNVFTIDPLAPTVFFRLRSP
jgi:autotransporter-associated beta strand protein